MKWKIFEANTKYFLTWLTVVVTATASPLGATTETCAVPWSSGLQKFAS